MITCTKLYSDIPFAHRQNKHDGHCSLIHGHNWSFEITFAAKQLDSNGFVVDFGKLKYIKKWIEDNLDHACLFNSDDKDILSLPTNLFKFHVVEDCSCEGLAIYLYGVFSSLIQEEEGDRVWIQSIRVFEDQKNSATYVK
jgi:6-pyruvoyltetrahydropterin/6-carboxytetrahydropterin synthase